MHAQLRSVMMSMLYPMYNWALKPGKVQGQPVYHHNNELASSFSTK